MSKKIGFIFFSLMCCARVAMASPNEIPQTAEWVTSSSVAAAGFATALGLHFVPTPNCLWCETNTFDIGVSQEWVWKNDRSAVRLLSDVFAYGVAPVMSLSVAAYMAGSSKQFGLFVLVLADSAAITLALTEAIKVSARRERPADPSIAYAPFDSDDANRSFLSGHTSFAFSLLTSASVMAFREGYLWAPHFATMSALAGIFVGYARVASGKHWLSDVAAGMGLGIAVGAAMPFLIDNKSDQEDRDQISWQLVPTFHRPGALLSLRF